MAFVLKVLKTVIGESGDVYVQVTDDWKIKLQQIIKGKIPKTLLIHTKQIYFTGVTWKNTSF